MPPCASRATWAIAASISVDVLAASVVWALKPMLGYSENSRDNGGTLSITDGTHAAASGPLGNYMASSFVTAADGHGGTLITEGLQTASQQPLLTQPHAT
jgi:hypothetical protein